MQTIPQSNLKLFINAVLLLFSVFAISSCVTRNKSDYVNYYDLGKPESIQIQGVYLDIVPFSNYSEVSSEMLYRIGENQVDFDLYNQWTAPPNSLLTTYFRRAINPNSGQILDAPEPLSMVLNASVTDFDIDLRNNKVILAVNYRIKFQGRTLLVQNRVFEQSFKERTPAAFASAMSLSASDFLKLFCAQVSELKDVINNERALQNK